MRVLEILRRRGVLFHHYYTPGEVPYGSVVYTDYKPIAEELASRSDLLVVYDGERSCRVLEKAIMATGYRERYNSVLIGVDPGSKISYVVVGDGELLLYGDGSTKELSKDIEYVVNCVHFDRVLARVGAGSKSGDVIVFLKKNFNLPIELVDEFSTTPSSSRITEVEYISKHLKGLKPFRHKGIYAAYRIALTSGVRVL